MKTLHSISPVISERIMEALMGLVNSHNLRFRISGDRIQYQFIDSRDPAYWTTMPVSEYHVWVNRYLTAVAANRFSNHRTAATLREETLRRIEVS